MLGFSRRSKKAKEIVAVADIASAGAMIALFEMGEHPRLLLHERVDLPITERPEDTRRTGVVRCLETAGERLHRSMQSAGIAANMPQRVYVIVHSPWSNSEMLRAASELEGETRIQGQHITDLAQEALGNVRDLRMSNLMESTVLRVALNGYPTPVPEGKSASRLEVFVLASDCDPTLQKMVSECLGRILPDRPLIWRSSTRAFFSLAQELPGHTPDYVGVVFGSTAGEIFVVRDGLLRGRSPLSIGTHSLMHKLSQHLPEEAHGLVELAARGASTPESVFHLHGKFARSVEATLASAFNQAFEALSVHGALPPQLILFAPAKISALLTHALKPHQVSRYTHASQPFSILHFSRMQGEVEGGEQDPDLAAASALINTEI